MHKHACASTINNYCFCSRLGDEEKVREYLVQGVVDVHLRDSKVCRSDL